MDIGPDVRLAGKQRNKSDYYRRPFLVHFTSTLFYFYANDTIILHTPLQTLEEYFSSTPEKVCN